MSARKRRRLATFLARFAALELEIKRDMDAGRGQCARHDRARREGPRGEDHLPARHLLAAGAAERAVLFPIGDPRQPLIVWSPKKAGDPAPVAARAKSRSRRRRTSTAGCFTWR